MQTDKYQEEREKIENHLREKAPVLPHFWQTMERMVINKEIKEECDFTISLMQQRDRELVALIKKETEWANEEVDSEVEEEPKWKAYYSGFREARKIIIGLINSKNNKDE